MLWCRSLYKGHGTETRLSHTGPSQGAWGTARSLDFGKSLFFFLIFLSMSQVVLLINIVLVWLKNIPHSLMFEPSIPSLFERQGLAERSELLKERFLSFLALSVSAFWPLRCEQTTAAEPSATVPSP